MALFALAVVLGVVLFDAHDLLLRASRPPSRARRVSLPPGPLEGPWAALRAPALTRRKAH